MVKAFGPGCLVTCDAPVKQFILHIDELRTKSNEGATFILDKLAHDPTHLIIQPDFQQWVADKIEEMQRSNSFAREE